MTFEDLETLQIEVGIRFGQECYLNLSRAEAYFDKVNEIFPNFFTRHDDFANVPTRFILRNSTQPRQCVAQLNRFNYIVGDDIDPDTFRDEAQRIFDVFKNLFALEDVRRIGKIYDFFLLHPSPKDLLSNLISIDEKPFQVNNLQLLFRRDGKNINVHFIAKQDQSFEINKEKFQARRGIIIRCDVNNIDMDSPLDIAETFTEVFELADQYVKTDLIDLVNRYLKG